MSDEEFLIVQAWVNEIVTLPQKTINTARQSRSIMNGIISELHRGGSTNKTSNQRPVVLLNSGYQMLNYIINEQLKRIVEQTNVLELGQGGGRQGRSVNINMHLVTHEAHRQGKRVYRVDINFRNEFSAMSQATLWHVINIFYIPDVDLLEQIYDSTTVRLLEWVCVLLRRLRRRCWPPPTCSHPSPTTNLCCACDRFFDPPRPCLHVNSPHVCER